MVLVTGRYRSPPWPGGDYDAADLDVLRCGVDDGLTKLLEAVQTIANAQ